ncbi:tandem-95 repeat protein [Salegentibacter sp. LM13S]|uniref:Ig-like domain-containing protein n=1 Tax=Salegentibacter lacus TaxID=2873599 RepID=UPI001CCAB587|nr:Ig-like domain-containing protein [Salegentibacter lacus]MBZ9630618.1 tandem-95 repeat protein [Salegentibacter lacus]
MKHCYSTHPGFIFRLQPFGATTAFFLLFFLLNFSFGFGQGITISSNGDEGPVFTQQQTIPLTFEFEEPITGFEESDINVDNGTLSDFFVTTPEFEWIESYDVDDFEVNLADAPNIEAKTDRVILSVATNSIGEIFVLTFGNGIIKYDLDGNRSTFNNGDDLESPLDIAFDSEDYLYVADNGQARQIKVYSPDGNFLPSRTIGSGNAGSSENNFYGPIGLAFDSEDNLYVTDAYNGPSQDEFDRYSVKIYYSNGDYVRFIGDNGYEFNNPYRIAVDDDLNVYVSDAGGDNGRVLVFDSEQNFIDILEGADDNLGSPGSIVIDNNSGFIYIADLGEEISIGQFLLAQQNPENLLDVFPDIVEGIENDEYEIKVFDESRNYIESISNNIDLPIDLALDSCGKLLVLNAYFSGEIFDTIFGPIPDIYLDFDIEFYNRLPNIFTANLEIDEECLVSEVSVAANVGEDAECNNTPASGDTFISTWDQTKPVRDICVEDDITVPSGFVVPDYIDNGQVSFSDNCGVESLTYSQTPEESETITQNTTVTITATDKAGNVSDVCSFDLVVTQQNSPPDAEDDIYEVDQGGILTISAPGVLLNDNDPDGDNLTAHLRLTVANGDFSFASNGSFTYEPDPGFAGVDVFTYEAYDGEEFSGEVTVTITVNSVNSAPLADDDNYTTNQDEILNISSPGVLGNDEDADGDPLTAILVDGSQNGTLDFNSDGSFSYEPAPGFSGVDTFTYNANDGEVNSNTAIVTITINSIDPNAPEIDCVNHEVFLDANGQATLDPEDIFAGERGNLVLSADIEDFDCSNLGENTVILTATDPDTGLSSSCPTEVLVLDDILPVANCVSGYVVNLDNNGTASINPEDLDDNSTDNCGIVSWALSQTEFTTADIGEVPVTLTVRDDAGNIDSCETTVEVRDEASGEFECRENIEVFLDENGEANLNLQDLYTGDASGINPTASRLNFTCEDLGTAIIQLDYSGEQTGSCMINVDVSDELPPEIDTNLVELTLNPEGFAYLEETDILAEDNCSEELIFRFGKSVFTCKDIGANTVNVEVEDASGNVTERNIQVKVNGESCEIPEEDGIEFLFLYPNPNNGIFTIATPEGMSIEYIRVFDSRGRYILQQNYNANARFYRMTIQGVEESVYTLQIFTNEGVMIKRAIIKR